MDFDDFKKAEEDRKRENFGKFKDVLDDVLKKEGSDMSADDMLAKSFGKKAANPQTTRPDSGGLSKNLMDAVLELRRETTDESVDQIVLRAVGTYRSIVRHVLAGGKVQFVDKDGNNPKTLKVRVKDP